MGGCEPCTHVVHPTINQTLTSSSVSCSCIRCSLHTPVLTIIHDLHLMSHNVVSSCHVAGISSRSGHACFFSTQCTSTYIVTYASPNQAALEDLSSSGRDAVVCTQRLLKRTGYWSASVVRIDLLQPRCLLLVARLQQTRLIELALCPNLVARGRHRRCSRQ